MNPGDTVKVTAGEFSGCAGQVTQRLSHSQGVPLVWQREVRVLVDDLRPQSVA